MSGAASPPGGRAWIGDEMFRLVITVKRGSASGFSAGWTPYATIEEARAAATAVLREERVLRVAIVRDVGAGAFVEWLDR